MRDITTVEQAEELVNGSSTQPVLLFKHSTRCRISAFAADQLAAVREEYADLPLTFARVLVVENRPISQWFAERLGVEHASPQIMLLSGGRVLWQATHFDITTSAIKRALDAVVTKET